MNIGILLNSHTNLNELAILLFQTDPLAYLLGPFVYFYGKSVFEEKLVFNFQLLLLCSPSILLFLNLLPYYQLSMEEKFVFIKYIDKNIYFRNFPKEYTLLFNYNFQRALIPLSNLSFLLYTFYYLLKKKSNVLMKPKISKIITSFVFIFVISAFPLLFYAIYVSFKSPLNSDLAFRLPLNINNLELYYLLTLISPLSFLLFPKFIYGFNPNASIVQWVKAFFSKKNSSDEIETNKPDYSDDSRQIMDYLEKEKPYLKIDFSLHDLSRELNIPNLRISSFFNKQLKTPFPEFRNRLRVGYAIQLFKEGMHAQMSIEGIATVCGFKNKSRFYAAFKAEYKMTPTEWIEKNK
jgi:AraC-like DNA-binding protein